MRVAIMQPTYLPWVGYFGLMHSVDLFLLLDSVQFARRSWQQRNRIKTANGPIWLTVPVLSRGRRDQRVAEVEIDRSRDFPRGHVTALELSYRKAPSYAAQAPALLEILGAEHRLLTDLTIGALTLMRDAFGITTPVRRASELAAEGTSAELLANLCMQVGATEYVSPPGSAEYLDASDAFQRAGIPYRYFEFAHPVYPQRFGEFLPFMSAVDLLFNCGPDALGLIDSGCRVTA
jgi:hypothetical protein